jgi:hypothetical protein
VVNSNLKPSEEKDSNEHSVSDNNPLNRENSLKNKLDKKVQSITRNTTPKLKTLVVGEHPLKDTEVIKENTHANAKIDVSDATPDTKVAIVLPKINHQFEKIEKSTDSTLNSLSKVTHFIVDNPETGSQIKVENPAPASNFKEEIYTKNSFLTKENAVSKIPLIVNNLNSQPQIKVENLFPANKDNLINVIPNHEKEIEKSDSKHSITIVNHISKSLANLENTIEKSVTSPINEPKLITNSAVNVKNSHLNTQSKPGNSISKVEALVKKIALKPAISKINPISVVHYKEATKISNSPSNKENAISKVPLMDDSNSSENLKNIMPRFDLSGDIDQSLKEAQEIIFDDNDDLDIQTAVERNLKP